MGSADRRARAKENLRRAILDAARELFATEDYKAVSLRRIAQKIEYSPTAIYLHFKDKQDILFSLIEEGFTMLLERLQPLMAVKDPLERLRKGGQVYLKFAFEQPHYYRLMFQLQDKQMADELMPKCEQGHQAFFFVCKSVMEAQERGYFSTDLPEPVISHAILSSMHGAASMTLSGHLGMLPGELHDQFYRTVIESTLRGHLK